MSCASSSFCVAVDSGGHETTWDGSTWSTVTSIDSTPYLNSVSCASSGFCVAVDAAGYAVTLSGATWSAPGEIDSGGGLTSVSCPRSSFCVAVDFAGNEIVWDGAAWASPANTDRSAGLNAVSCGVSGFCAAVDTYGAALTREGGSWSTTAGVDAINQMTSVSCVGSSFCMAVDGSGYYLRYSVPLPRGYQIAGLSASWPAGHWRAGTAHDITATVLTPGGGLLRARAAAAIAASCGLMLTGSGAQHLGRACMRYDARSGRFTYEWHVLPRVHGAEYLQLQLAYPCRAIAYGTVDVARRSPGRPGVRSG